MLKFIPATQSDSKLILSYIKKLADAEQFPFEVSVTQSDIKENLLAKNSIAEAVIFYLDNNPCGFAVYYETFSTTTGKRGLHLDDLYVEPAYHGQGIGKKAITYLSNIAKQRGCARFEWWALNTNDNAIKFYLKLGAKRVEEISVFRLNRTQIEDLAKDDI